MQTIVHLKCMVLGMLCLRGPSQLTIPFLCGPLYLVQVMLEGPALCLGQPILKICHKHYYTTGLEKRCLLRQMEAFSLYLCWEYGTLKTYVKIYKEDKLFTTSEFVSVLIQIQFQEVPEFIVLFSAVLYGRLKVYLGIGLF